LSAGLPEPALLTDSGEVLDFVKRHRFSMVILDLLMPEMSGMEILQQLKSEFPSIEVVILTAIDEVDSAVQAMQYGAFDYLVKPVSGGKLLITIQRAMERQRLRQELSLYERTPSMAELQHPEPFADMIATDELMARVFHLVESVAPTDYNVFITGESGTGKELLARIIHKLSPRFTAPFVAVNMAAFSRELFEAEFFGHTRGSFTGALHDKRGFFEAAHRGTLFLDEITELGLDLQAKLLRVIQEKELFRLGSTQARPVDLRFIASSNGDPREEVKKQNFRSDLFYRLNMCHIHIPALRERKKDILPLTQHFLKKHSANNRKNITSLAPDLESRLLNYSYPGNVRELENIIAAAVAVEKGKMLTLSSARHFLPTPMEDLKSDEDLPLLEELVRRHILRVLTATGGNRTHAAKILGIGLRTLQRKLAEIAKSDKTARPRRFDMLD
jgi:DNA-binding NtrC family response regulator